MAPDRVSPNPVNVYLSILFYKEFLSWKLGPCVRVLP